MKKIIITCALLCLCGCSVPPKAHVVPQKTPPVLQQTQPAPTNNTTVTNPSEPPSDAVDMSSLTAMTPQTVITSFANLLDVTEMQKDQFVFVTLDGEQRNIDGIAIYKRNILSGQEAALDTVFQREWLLHDSGKLNDSEIALYLKDNVVCKKHLIVYGDERGGGTYPTGRDVYIVCGISGEEMGDDLYPYGRDLNSGACIEAQKWVIMHSEEVQSHIAAMQKEIQANGCGAGLADFELLRDQPMSTDMYFVLMEIYNKPDGTTDRKVAMNFWFDPEAEEFFVDDPVTKNHHALHYADHTTMDTFRKKCAQEMKKSAEDAYLRLR